MVVGLAVAVALPIVTSIFVPGEQILGLVGVILLIGGAVTLYLFEQGRRLPSAIALTATSVLFVTSIFGFAAVRVDQHQFAKPLLADIHGHCPGDPEIATFRFIRESLVFYSGRQVEFCSSGDQVRRFLDGSQCPYIVTIDDHEPAIDELFGEELAVVARRPRFLRSGEVVVYAPRPGLRVMHTAGRMDADVTR